jgi:MoxR-like ATPase
MSKWKLGDEITTWYSSKYDEEGRVVVYDEMEKLYIDLSLRPDIKQRAEKAINTNTILATYKRGTRNGFVFLSPKEIKQYSSPPHQPLLRRIENFINQKPHDFFVTDLNWKFLLRNIVKAKNLLIVGPSGCGKTQLSFIAGTKLEREIEYFNLGSTQDPRSTLIGNTLYDKDKGTYFSESQFIQAIQKPNSVILLDEISRAHPEAWNILMTVLDENLRYLRIDEKDSTPLIKVAEGVSFIATANIGTEYTATRIMDRALKDRFSILEIEPLKELDEINILSKKFKETVPYDIIKRIANVASKTRKEVKAQDSKISTIISTRKTIEWCDMVQDGFTFEEAAQIVIYPLFPDDGEVDGERVYIKQLLQKYNIENDKLEETIDKIFNT